MKTIIKADIQAVTDTGLPFTLHRTDAGTWEAKITVKTSTGAPLTYFYSASTLEGLQTFIDGVEHTTQTIEQENTNEEDDDEELFDDPLEPHYIRG